MGKGGEREGDGKREGKGREGEKGGEGKDPPLLFGQIEPCPCLRHIA